MPGATSKPLDLKKAIIKAAKNGNLAGVKALVEHDPSLLLATDTDGSTPLHCAVWKGHVAVVALLLELGANVNARNNNDHWGTSPLHAAAHANQRAIAEMLIKHGADIHATNINGRTPLAETEFHKAKPVAKLLMEHGAID